MSLRVREDGRVMCAAMHPWKPGDTYLPDSISERLTGCTGMPAVLVTEPMDLPEGVGRGGHRVHGEWWWADQVPVDVRVEGEPVKVDYFVGPPGHGRLVRSAEVGKWNFGGAISEATTTWGLPLPPGFLPLCSCGGFHRLAERCTPPVEHDAEYWEQARRLSARTVKSSWWKRWWSRRSVRKACPAGAAVARRGIVVGSAHADRGTDSGRFPEKARIHALATVRRAMTRTASKDVTHE